MSYVDNRAKRMTIKNVKEHIKAFVLESINDSNTPNHFDLEQSCLTDTKISDVQRSFVIFENEYRSLITFLFENDKQKKDKKQTGMRIGMQLRGYN